jgi:hypothetical protein
MIYVFDESGRLKYTQMSMDKPAQMAALRACGEMFVDTGTWAPGVPLHDTVLLPVPRPDMPITVSKTEIVADGEDAALLEALPMPCRVRVATADHADVMDVADGRCELATTVPDTYTVTVEAWPYRDFTVTITAT